MIKKLLLFLCLILLLTACSSSDKVYTFKGCSFALNDTWTDSMSTEDTGIYSSEDDDMAINIDCDTDPLSLPDYLADKEYEVGSVTVDGEDVRLFTYQEDRYYVRRFQVERLDGTYSFTVMSGEENPATYDKFLQTIKFND